MLRRNQNSEALKFGDIVEAAYELGSLLAPDRAMAGDLAARHLERVLVRGGNLRLVAELADLARDLAPSASHARRSRSHARPSGSAQLAAAH
jgi:hypothetical protein